MLDIYDWYECLVGDGWINGLDKYINYEEYNEVTKNGFYVFSPDLLLHYVNMVFNDNDFCYGYIRDYDGGYSIRKINKLKIVGGDYNLRCMIQCNSLCYKTIRDFNRKKLWDFPPVIFYKICGRKD